MAKARRPRAAGRRQRTIYLPESIDRKVRVRAAQLDTTISDVVAEALRTFFIAQQAAAKKKGKVRTSSGR